MVQMPDYNELMKQAQAMQQKMQEAQDELGRFAVEGKAGVNLVKVTMNGHHQVSRFVLDDELFDEDKAVIEDLLAAAVNDAVKKIESEARNRIMGLTKELGLPDGFDGGEGGSADS